ncbi:Protein of unknown function [Gryllus bimaculatus]|nr:Protein of unknown function [Gryllus bimaculatus]
MATWSRQGIRFPNDVENKNGENTIRERSSNPANFAAKDEVILNAIPGKKREGDAAVALLSVSPNSETSVLRVT